MNQNNTQPNRIAQLASMNEKIFHARDLANLWQIKAKNTLYVTLKRYAQSGTLFRIYKGFYSLQDPAKLNPVELGAKAISRFCYLGMETVLYREGYISQPPTHMTFVGAKNLILQIGRNNYKCRSLQDKFLFHPAGILQKSSDSPVLTASPERAIADMLYFNPKFHFDREPNWAVVRKLQQQIGYPLTPKRYAPATTK